MEHVAKEGEVMRDLYSPIKENAIISDNPYTCPTCEGDTNLFDHSDQRRLDFASERDSLIVKGEHAKKVKMEEKVDTRMETTKYLYSMGLLIISSVVVIAAIFSEQTTGTAYRGIPPVLAFIIFWYLVAWLALMEGGQSCLVGLQPINKKSYQESHPITFMNTTIAHEGDNMERFIIGRQFLVVLVVFGMSIMASAVVDASILGLPDLITEIFLVSGSAVILISVILGLTAQVNAADCMIDFINNHFMTFTTYASLAMETSGVLHATYLVQILFAKVTGTPIESKEPARSTFQNVLFWGRVAMSVAILSLSFVVTLAALFAGKTTVWDGVPASVSVILFFMLMALIGIMEGLQIALFAVVHIPEAELKQHSVAYANCQLTFSDKNLQAFLIGRQICVTMCMLFVARITTLDYGIGDANVFGVSDGLQDFFNTGMLGALITTLVASLAWRIVASSFPVAFLSSPFTYFSIRLCLALEASGVLSASWVMAFLHKKIVGYRLDENFIGTAEERAAASTTLDMKDEEAPRRRETETESPKLQLSLPFLH